MNASGGSEAAPGAAPGAWEHWDFMLDVGRDILPVVSNPTAVINPGSTLKSLGKLPSRYTARRQVVGIPNWTRHVSTAKEIAEWSREPDYGIALITRTVRALDVDVTDPVLAAAIRDAIKTKCGIQLPMRTRSNSSKFLLLFSLPGELPKRILTTADGAIEMLGSGQQCLVGGLHPSGVPYEWPAGLPNEIPALTLEQFESLWKMLEQRFAIGASTTSKTSTKAATLGAAIENDSVAQELIALGATVDRDGKLRLPSCPFSDGHTPGGDDSVIYFPRATGGYTNGNVRCLHASCAGRTRDDFLVALGVTPEPHDYRDDFAAIPEPTAAEKAARYPIVGEEAYSAGKPMGWIVKGLLPKGELGTIFGPPASGKSFWVLDLVECVARGVPWCGKKVTQGDVVYIAAEGAGGFKTRIAAYRTHHGISPGTPGVNILAAVPNLMTKQDVIDLGNAVLAFGKPALIVYDTLARGTAGADENSAKDMGLAIANCRRLYEATGAMILLVAHTGKDTSKGMRGSNAPLGAVDVEIEISRSNDNRTATVKKLKDGGPDGEAYGFKLVTVPVGMDEDGDVISSCVVEHGAVVVPKVKERPMGEHEKTVLRAANNLQNELAGTRPSINEIIETATNETPRGASTRDRRSDVLRRAFNRLVDSGVLEMAGGGVAVGGAR